MTSEPAAAREAVGLSDGDLRMIRRVARRRKIVLAVGGGVAAVAGFVSGYLVARSPDQELYPFAVPIAAVGITGKKSKIGVAIISIAAAAAAFTLAFILAAAAYTPDDTAIRYGVFGDELTNPRRQPR